MLRKTFSPLLSKMFDSITTTSRPGNQDKAKGRLLVALLVWATQQLEAPIWAHPDSWSLWILTAPCAADNPKWPPLRLPSPDHFCKLGPGVSWWPCRNEEQGSMWQAWSNWVWMTCQRPIKVLWGGKKNKINTPNYMNMSRLSQV